MSDDMLLSLEKEWENIIAFKDEHFPDWRTKHDDIYFGNAMAGELGEVCSNIKKQAGGGTSNKAVPTDEDVFEESADLFVYLVLFLARKGLTAAQFAQAVRRKMNINVERMRIRREMMERS